MTSTARRVRGILGTGLVWAVCWAALGLGIGAASLVVPNPAFRAFVRIFDAPLPALGVPGFVGGVFYASVLAVAARRRRFADLSVPRVAAWGAVAGVMLGALPMTIGTPASERPLVPAAVALIGLGAAFCAASAAMSLMLARRAERAVPTAFLPPAATSDGVYRDVGDGREDALSRAVFSRTSRTSRHG